MQGCGRRGWLVGSGQQVVVERRLAGQSRCCAQRAGSTWHSLPTLRTLTPRLLTAHLPPAHLCLACGGVGAPKLDGPPCKEGEGGSQREVELQMITSIIEAACRGVVGREGRREGGRVGGQESAGGR